MKWFRLYNETIHDRKLRRLPPAQRWLWITILCAASDSPDRGRLLLSDGEPVTVADLVDMAALPAKSVRDGLAALERLDMIQRNDGTIIVTKWGERQHKSDNSTERWRRWKSQQAANDEPTLGQQPANVGTNVGETYPPTATDTDTDTELVSSDELTPAGPVPISRSRPRDPIFEAFCDVLDLDPKRLNKTERGRINSACRDIRDVGGTPDDIRLAAERYRQKWPDIDMTAKGISGNWQTLLNGSGAPRVVTAEDLYRIAE